MAKSEFLPSIRKCQIEPSNTRSVFYGEILEPEIILLLEVLENEF